MDENRIGRLAIIDADNHIGNGTDSLLDRLNLRDYIYHYTFGLHFGPGSSVEAYIAQFDSIESELKSFAPQLLLYGAGVDPHQNDLLGGFMTTEQLYARDRRMFQVA